MLDDEQKHFIHVRTFIIKQPAFDNKKSMWDTFSILFSLYFYHQRGCTRVNGKTEDVH